MLRAVETCLVVTFHTTAGAIAMEKLCKARSIPGRLIPVPRSITSDCGIAWRAFPADKAVIEAAAAENGLEAAGYYETEL